MEGKAFTPDEVAQLFQISKHTVYELIKRGELQAFKVGNKMRIEHSEIERYKERTKAPAKKRRWICLIHRPPNLSDYLEAMTFLSSI